MGPFPSFPITGLLRWLFALSIVGLLAILGLVVSFIWWACTHVRFV